MNYRYGPYADDIRRAQLAIKEVSTVQELERLELLIDPLAMRRFDGLLRKALDEKFDTLIPSNNG